MGKMSDCVWRRIHVKRRVWAETKAEAERRDENVSDLAGELLEEAIRKD